MTGPASGRCPLCGAVDGVAVTVEPARKPSRPHPRRMARNHLDVYELVEVEPD